MNNKQSVQAIISIAALGCIIVGWFNLFSPEINHFIYQKLFYILIGISFILMAPALIKPKFKIPLYVAAGLCIAGVLIPETYSFSGIKSIGLFCGVIISLFSRRKI